MNNIVIAENGRVRSFEDMELAEDIIKTKNTKDSWAVIDKLVNAWARRAPEDVKALEINLTQYRENAVDKVFGQTVGGKDQERRFKLAFPYSLMMMIRSIYKAEDLKLDSKFYDEFAKRYPYFRVAEKD
jgi:hypothetical protein